MKVDVVIPFQNRSYSNSLWSVMNQSYPDIDVHLIGYTGKWNVSRARNRGIKEAKGEITIVIDADIIMEKEVVNTLVQMHLADPQAYITAQVRMLLEDVKMPEDYDKLEQIWKGWSLGFGGLFSAPTEWWVKVRGFDERRDCLLLEDVDMRERAQMDDRNCKFLNRMELHRDWVHVYHEKHPNSFMQLTKKQVEDLARRRWSFRKIEKTVVLNPESWG